MNGYSKIKAAQQANEQWLIDAIKREGFWYPNYRGTTSVAMYNAKDRLVAASKIRYEASAAGGAGGYVLNPKRKGK